jgi:hypothetical protein
MDTFMQSTLQSGFSIVVAAFLLLRMERELRALRQSIDRLRHCQVCRFAPGEPIDVFNLFDEKAQEALSAPSGGPVS